MKTEETKTIEKVLAESLFGTNHKLAKEYGTTEVTIGFQRNHGGKEIVDFLSYDAKTQMFRCYEIKVSMSDFRSSAKKSWRGNYNYLVLSEKLYKEQLLEKWKKEIPKEIGIVVVNTETGEKYTAKKAVKKEIKKEEKEILKDSLLRTMFYQKVATTRKTGGSGRGL